MIFELPHSKAMFSVRKLSQVLGVVKCIPLIMYLSHAGCLDTFHYPLSTH
jgi:hypothetical protein